MTDTVDFNPVPKGGAFMTSPADAMAEPHVDKDGSTEPVEAWRTALHQMIYNAIRYTDGELSTHRAESEKYFKGEPLGNERDGRSKFVSTELRDAVLMIMPSLLKLFFAPTPAVEYVPSNATPETVQKTEQITQFILDVVLQQDNSGFLTIHNAFWDALVKRIGIIKYWQDTSKETRAFQLAYVSLEQLTLLAQDTTIEVDEISPSEYSPPGANLYDVDYTQHRSWSRTRIACVPPEEYLFTKGARTSANDPGAPGVAPYVGHRTELTRSQLRAMGISEEDIEKWAFRDASLSGNVEEIERQDHKVTDIDVTGLEAEKRALYIESYPYLPLNGEDEPAVLCKVIHLGPQYHVIGDPEPCARRPFALFTPNPIPHTVIGQGLNDMTMDLQMVVSMIWRAMLDSLALSLQPRIGYVEGNVSLADLMNTKLSAPIRMRQQGDIQPIEHEFVGAQALPVLQAIADIKENRVGVTKASAGLDASALQSSSAAAVSAAVTNAQQHIEMIGRVFAETGMRDLMRGLLELQVENQNGPRIAKVCGQYIEMDPRSWDAGLDVRVNLAIGAGTSNERFQTLMDVATKMENIFATWGPANPMCGPKEYRDVLVKALKHRGEMDADGMFKEVDPNWQPPAPPPGAGDPNMVIAQAEASKAAAEVQSKQHDAELAISKHQVDVARRAEDLQLQAQKMEMDDSLEREKIEADIVLQLMELKLKYGTQYSIEELKAQMASLRTAPQTRKVVLKHAAGHEVHVAETQ